MRHHIGVGRVQANRRIEVQHLAEPRRRPQQLGLDLLEVGLAPLQVGGGPVGIGIAALTGDGVIGRQLGDGLCLFTGLKCHGVSSFRPQQFTEGQRNLQENLVADRDIVKLALPHELPACQVVEDPHGGVATQEDSRDVDGSRGNRVGACPDINRASVHRKDVAVGLLEIAAVGVIIHTRIDRGQEPGRGELTDGHGLENALPGHIELGVLHAREPQSRVKIDRVNFGAQNRGRGDRRGQGELPVGLFLFPQALPVHFPG